MLHTFVLYVCVLRLCFTFFVCCCCCCSSSFLVFLFVFAGAERIFDGHGNVQRAMERAVATWNPRTLVIGGQSAGGFGSVSSFASVRDHFPKARAVLIDDSGPVIDDKALAPCLQAKWREV